MIPYLLQCYFSTIFSRLPVSHCLIACYSRSTSITVCYSLLFSYFSFLSEASISLSWILNSSCFNSYNTGLAPSFHSLPRNIQKLFTRCRDFRREEQSESSILFAFNSIITSKIVWLHGTNTRFRQVCALFLIWRLFAYLPEQARCSREW